VILYAGISTDVKLIVFTIPRDEHFRFRIPHAGQTFGEFRSRERQKVGECIAVLHTLAVRHALASARLSRTSRMSRWDIDGLSMLKSSSSSGGLTITVRRAEGTGAHREHGGSGNAASVHGWWMHQRKRHCWRNGHCAQMPFSTRERYGMIVEHGGVTTPDCLRDTIVQHGRCMTAVRQQRQA